VVPGPVNPVGPGPSPVPFQTTPTAVGGGPAPRVSPPTDTGAPTGFPATTPDIGPSAGTAVPGGGTGAFGGGTMGPISTGIRPGATYGVVSAAPAGSDTQPPVNTPNVPGVSGAFSPQSFQGS